MSGEKVAWLEMLFQNYYLIFHKAKAKEDKLK